jgi:hypothetical protein
MRIKVINISKIKHLIVNLFWKRIWILNKSNNSKFKIKKIKFNLILSLYKKIVDSYNIKIWKIYRLIGLFQKYKNHPIYKTTTTLNRMKKIDI